MYVNKCIKCGREFETKNPKRVICPDCLYPEKKMMLNSGDSPESDATPNQESTPREPLNNYSTPESRPQHYSNYSSGGYDNQRPYNRPQRQYQNQNGGRYNNRDNRGGYNRSNSGGYNNRYSNNGRDNNRTPGYRQNNRPGNFQQRRPQNNRFNNRRPGGRNAAPKQLLVTREQLEQIELLYKLMLPLPNPDAHEVIGEKISLEPRKVFFGINLVRQKMMLPKLPYPKRKLAITPDQLNAIKMLYEPLLPLPPIGCHKIIASQLKMDEWRVHVGIGLVRAQMGLDRWNAQRPDAPEEFRVKAENSNTDKETEAKAENTTETDVKVTEEAPKKKRGRKPKTEEPSTVEE